ncbi:BCCT family transporter [Abyssicoccus albus]|uniref:BCCT family transporter n=1 Tax=Abyssicoccus albus TaxID=1817405 RepID=UPI00137238C0|nr:BCCT family transporter [Abyssicoccus albus]
MNIVFIVAAIIIVIFAALAFLFPTQFGEIATNVYDTVATNFSWLFLLAVFIFVVFLISLAISPYGRIKFGRNDEEPEFSFRSWIGMLFSGGLGVGLVFYGVAEPMTHMADAPFAKEMALGEQARVAMGYTFFHWGMSQWAVFAIAGLAIGYYQFRRERNGLISTALEPLFGMYYPNWIRKVIDILAVIATVTGIATSIGLGIMQVNGGLNITYNIPNNNVTLMIITLLMTVIFIISATTGLKRGVKYLSNMNMAICVLLILFVLIFGPTRFILETFVVGVGDYITNFIPYSLRLNPFVENGESQWVQDWTVFYWAWVIAWSPFIGAFIARISRGRTIREYVLGVLIIPPLLSFVWMATLGGSAIYMDLFESTNLVDIVQDDNTKALFAFFNELPFGLVTSTLAIVLIFTFIVTSADSATYIVSSMTSNGDLNPSMRMKISWGIIIASITLALITTDDGLTSLQTGAIVAGLPFTFILLMLIISMLIALRKEPNEALKRVEKPKMKKKYPDGNPDRK